MKKIFSMCLSLLISSTVLTSTSLAVDPPFTQEENQKLIQLVEEHSDSNWSLIASFMENRDEMQCKDQWENYLADIRSEIESLLNRYCSSDVSEEEILQICNDVTEFLANEPSLLEINGTTIVVGDLHGDIKALEYYCKNGLLHYITEGAKVLFLGDYVDREKNGIEVISSLFKLKTIFPNNIFLLRGNHEEINMNMQYGFAEECEQKYEDNGQTF